jgi:hypothetical protein
MLKLRRIVLLLTGLAVVLNAWAARQLCLLNPDAEPCASIAPGPKATGSGPQPKPIPVNQVVTGTAPPSGKVSLSGRTMISLRLRGLLSLSAGR